MKIALSKAWLALLLTLMLAATAHAQARIATIDLAKVFDNYWKTKQASATLKDRAADMEKEHKNMLEDWKKAKDDYQGLLAAANDQAVSSDERDKKKRSAEDKLKYIKDTEDTIVQYEKQARVTLEEQERRIRENILGEIRTVVSSKAKAGGYTLVLDTAAQTPGRTPIVVYSGNDNDITDAVLSQLNTSAPAETPASEEKKVEKKDEKKKSP